MSQQADAAQEPESSAATTISARLASTLGRELWLDRVTGRRSFPGPSFPEYSSPEHSTHGNPESHPTDDSFLRPPTPTLAVTAPLARPGGGRQPESLPALLHDARNMVAALDLYCDLLDEPDVLTESYRHYATELRMVGNASRRLLDKLAFVNSATAQSFTSQALPSIHHSVLPSDSLLDFTPESGSDFSYRLPSQPPPEGRRRADNRRGLLVAQPIQSLAAELQANLNLIAALVGPAVTVGLSIAGGNCPIGLTGDDLTRVLVNLARNAAEAMPSGGHIQIDLEETQDRLSLTLTDNGPGIPESALETIFSPGYTAHVPVHSSYKFDKFSPDFPPDPPSDSWPVHHSGLGLSIVRSIVTAAGGRVWAANRSNALSASSGEPSRNGLPESISSIAPGTGAILRIEFPIAFPIAANPRMT